MQIHLCDLACWRKTGKRLPNDILQIIHEYYIYFEETCIIEKQRKLHQLDYILISKGARKKHMNNSTKHILTKFRMKQAFRWR